MRATQLRIGKRFAYQSLVRRIAFPKERSTDRAHFKDICELGTDRINLRERRVIGELDAHLSAVVIGHCCEGRIIADVLVVAAGHMRVQMLVVRKKCS